MFDFLSLSFYLIGQQIPLHFFRYFDLSSARQYWDRWRQHYGDLVCIVRVSGQLSALAGDYVQVHVVVVVIVVILVVVDVS